MLVFTALTALVAGVFALLQVAQYGARRRVRRPPQRA
jgi:hypothetical protein